MLVAVVVAAAGKEGHELSLHLLLQQQLLPLQQNLLQQERLLRVWVHSGVSGILQRCE